MSIHEINTMLLFQYSLMIIDILVFNFCTSVARHQVPSLTLYCHFFATSLLRCRGHLPHNERYYRGEQLRFQIAEKSFNAARRQHMTSRIATPAGPDRGPKQDCFAALAMTAICVTLNEALLRARS